MSERRPLIAANWKMNTTLAEGMELCQALRGRLDGLSGCQVVICPPYTHLAPARDYLAGSTLLLGAQSMYSEPKGAFTGEISGGMLRELVAFVIIGHSERRAYFGETDAVVNQKLRAALAAGLQPIVCVGETEDEHARGQTEAVLRRQIRVGLREIEAPPKLVIAYEPVWAIGTGASAGGVQAQSAISLIRAELSLLSPAAQAIRHLYGGSVTAANIAEFMREPDIDGALVGGASLSAESFSQIVRGAVEST
ncbi:MAG: triose-phosphate isomerase [Dehalococcoidia bacterium]